MILFDVVLANGLLSDLDRGNCFVARQNRELFLNVAKDILLFVFTVKIYLRHEVSFLSVVVLHASDYSLDDVIYLHDISL